MSILYSAPFAILLTFILHFHINFIFYCSDSRKFSRSTFARSLIFKFEISGGDQNMERRNIERPKFRNFKIANIKITKVELFDNFIFKFNVSFFKIICIPKIFNNFLSCEILILQTVELIFFHFPNC